jgi:hypothetical protein
MATNAIRGPGIYPPPNYQLLVGTTSVTVGNGPISLAAGEAYVLPPGQFIITPGPYTFIQVFDQVLNKFRHTSQTPNMPRYVASDGSNYRLVNLTGCAIGAFLTNCGSGYTSAPVVTASSGSSSWLAIVGGAINSTVTITTGGSYTYAPQLIISPPPIGGVQATAYCTISAGTINAVTVVDQGAGYTSVPTITVVPDPRETLAGGGVLTINATLAGSGAITALLNTNHGTALTSVPTFTFTGGGGSSAAATAVMCFTATGIGSITGGAAYGTSQPFGVMTLGGQVSGTAGSVVNPSIGNNLLVPRMANMSGTSTGGGAITATGFVVTDGGLFTAVPTAAIIPAGNSIPTTIGQATVTVGGVSDTSWIMCA